MPGRKPPSPPCGSAPLEQRSRRRLARLWIVLCIVLYSAGAAFGGVPIVSHRVQAQEPDAPAAESPTVESPDAPASTPESVEDPPETGDPAPSEPLYAQESGTEESSAEESNAEESNAEESGADASPVLPSNEAPTSTPESRDPPPLIYFSEFMIHPRAVVNQTGEWLELHNGGATPVNLRNWVIGSHTPAYHRITHDVWIAPGGYVIVARHADSAANGGVAADYVYPDLALANWGDVFLLSDPEERLVDQFSVHAVTVVPQDYARPVRIGASIERTGFDAQSEWRYAHAPWPTSRGDWGSPGTGYIPRPQPSPEPALPPAPEASPAPVAPPVIPPAPPPMPSPIPVPVHTRPEILPQLRISEVMPDPQAVYDDVGEWFELVNLGQEPVNLDGWLLADSRTDRHVIQSQLWIQPGQYLVLGRVADRELNGGVPVQYAVRGLTLANAEDDLHLIAPWGDVIDAVAWGGATGFRVRAGISLERVDWNQATGWAYAYAPWPGSAGDWGSPGGGYLAPTPTATATPVDTPTPLPTATTTPTPHPDQPPLIRISELMIDPDAVADELGEWIELVNLGPEAVNLIDWTLHDLRQDHHRIIGDLWLAPGAVMVLTRHADPTMNGGVFGAYTYRGIRLANDDDALILSTPWGREADRVVWGRAVGLPVRRGQSLERTDLTARTGPETGLLQGSNASWSYGHAPWPESAGDWGTPGQVYTPPPSPTPTQHLPTPPPSAPPTATPTATPLPVTPPHILFSEIMVDPHVVPDHLGEWFELTNAGNTAVNLGGWRVTDLGSDEHVIEGDLWLAPGAHAVLARHGDPAANGGVHADYVYRGLQLANTEDALLLHTPWGATVDRVEWGKARGLPIQAGVSLERALPHAAGDWLPAIQMWPGSAGDWGTPGRAFTPRPAIQEPTSAPTPTPMLSLGSVWSPASQPGALVIDQIYYGEPDLEFVTLLNRAGAPVWLDGYVVGDAERPGKQEGLYALPPGIQLMPGQRFVLARRAQAFFARWGQWPHAEFEATATNVPTLERRRDLAGGAFALNNAGDEVVLLAPGLELIDAVVYRNGDYAAASVQGRLQAASGESLQRVPGVWFPTVTEQRHRFLSAPPAPFQGRDLPSGAAHSPVQLGDGLLAAWGSLGVASTFSVGGFAPPHYLLAAAAANGLDFLAIADDAPHAPSVASAATAQTVVHIPAWRWRGADGNQAIVYSRTPIVASTWGELWDGVASYGGIIQRHGGQSQAGSAPSVIRADHIDAPGGTLALYRAWTEVGEPLLPGGNGAPHIPGVFMGRARYTGLAVSHAQSDGILAALAQRRGWLTSRPGIWLTLRSHSGVWMGSRLAPAERITLQIEYGDRLGAPAGLALWQNDRILHQLDTPPPDGQWTIEIPAVPGAFLYVVATQLSGDFAVTAPILVEYGADQTLVAPEVAPPTSHTPPASRPGGSLPSPAAADAVLPPTHGQATGPPGSLAAEKLRGLNEMVEFRAQVIVPPGLFNSAIYVAEPARLENGAELPIAGLGIQVYLRTGGVFPPLAEGDWVWVRGRLRTHRGEMEVQIDLPDQVWRIGPGAMLFPLPVQPSQVGESLEGRLVTVRGAVTRWQGASIYLADLDDPQAEPVRVTVRSSLNWKRPYVQVGQVFQATGVVSQFAQRAPWNGGYRLLVRYAEDLIRVDGD